LRRIAVIFLAGIICLSSCEKAEPVIDAVDLGLSVKWARCNLDAKSVESYGGFYAWGETETRMSFGYSYKFFRDYETPYHFTKYCTDPECGTVDNRVVLEACDDAAAVKLGNGWRIPTALEWKELVDNCHWVWTDGFDDLYVPGFLVFSNIPGYEHSYIFLPVLGYISNAHYHDRELGFYWTSNLDEKIGGNALCLKIFEDDQAFCTAPRCNMGFQIRAVHE